MCLTTVSYSSGFLSELSCKVETVNSGNGFGRDYWEFRKIENVTGCRLPSQNPITLVSIFFCLEISYRCDSQTV